MVGRRNLSSPFHPAGGEIDVGAVDSAITAIASLATSDVPTSADSPSGVAGIDLSVRERKRGPQTPRVTGRAKGQGQAARRASSDGTLAADDRARSRKRLAQGRGRRRSIMSLNVGLGSELGTPIESVDNFSVSLEDGDGLGAVRGLLVVEEGMQSCDVGSVAGSREGEGTGVVGDVEVLGDRLGSQRDDGCDSFIHAPPPRLAVSVRKQKRSILLNSFDMLRASGELDKKLGEVERAKGIYSGTSFAAAASASKRKKKLEMKAKRKLDANVKAGRSEGKIQSAVKSHGVSASRVLTEKSGGVTKFKKAGNSRWKRPKVEPSYGEMVPIATRSRPSTPTGNGLFVENGNSFASILGPLAVPSEGHRVVGGAEPRARSKKRAASVSCLEDGQPRPSSKSRRLRHSDPTINLRSGSRGAPLKASISSRTRARRGSSKPLKKLEPDEIVDLTQPSESDVEDDFPASAGIHGKVWDDAGTSANKGGIPLVAGPVKRTRLPLVKRKLTRDELDRVDKLTTGSRTEEPLSINPDANITLRRRDYKRLRGVRWLNDELLNTYVAMVNVRDKFFFQSPEAHYFPSDNKVERPRSYMFNSFFYTRLTSTGYDYDGVARWTRRAKVDVLEKDLLLIPVNIGGSHWILAGVDIRRRCFLYLDSFHGRDSTGVLPTLRNWFYDEVKNKHEQKEADVLDLESWDDLENSYLTGFDDKCVAIPLQEDGGSCGVFTAKIADCLALGISVYFGHKTIKSIRQRMALDLYERVLPG